MNIRWALIVACAGMTSCATQPRVPPQELGSSQELFDEQSAVTVLVVAKPLVFARARSDVAAHARDYATLVAVELDRSGEYSQFLLLYRWSIVDPRMSPPPAAHTGELRIVADGRLITLMPLAQMPVSLSQRRALHVPDHGDVIPHAYQIDSATLQFVANSHDVILRMPQELLDTPFQLWEDGRSALREFLKRAVAP